LFTKACSVSGGTITISPGPTVRSFSPSENVPSLLTHLEGDRARADALLDRLRELEPLASRLLTP
jgi:hypothetical protein